MAFALKWEPRGVVIEFGGHVSIVDLVQATTDVESHPLFDDIQYMIADYRGIESCNARPVEMESVWVLDCGARRTNHRVRKAVVTTRPEVLALARQYATSYGSGGFEVGTFETLGEARAWLA